MKMTQTAEPSAAGAMGFGMAAGRQLAAALTQGSRQIIGLLTQASPVSIAIAGTAFAAAGLFVAVDAVRTLGDAGTYPAIVEAANSGPAATGFVASAGALRTVPAGSATLVALEDGAAAIIGIAQRSAGAFGAALVASRVGYRRRPVVIPAGPHPSAATEMMIEALPGGIACWTARGELDCCNRAYQQHLFWSGPEIEPGLPYAAAMERLTRGASVTLTREDESCRMLEVRRPDALWLTIEERPLPGGGFMTLVSDVTDRRQEADRLVAIQDEQRQLARRFHEEKLKAEAASRAKTAFLAHLSHDIRTPLNHIIGFAELIRHQTYGPLGDARYVNYIDTIKGSGEKLLTFFASLLELAELESGQRALKQDLLIIDDLLEATARRFKAQAARAGLALTVGVPCGAILRGDRFCLERVLGNVVENALRFTPSGGRVALAAYAAEDGVVLEIADTGTGLSEERLEAVSQPFAFGDASLARETGGPGLGLPIARAIVEQSGGQLIIDSRLGLGTTVAITLPLAEVVHHAERAA
jgi:two-component system cell cycle sensor histidine kinase PleC